MKVVVLLWLFCGGVLTLGVTHLPIDKLLDHHKKLEFNSIHSKFGFWIASKLDTKYKHVLWRLAQKPILGEENLSEDVRSVLNGLKYLNPFEIEWKSGYMYRFPGLADCGSYQNYEEGYQERALSDKCLSEILSHKSCVLSQKCIQMVEDKNIVSLRYSKTHQLLFLLFLKQQKCTRFLSIDQSADFLLEDFCLEIFNEMGGDLECKRTRKGNPYHFTPSATSTLPLEWVAALPPQSHDLFLEQALLCGLSGFTEFMEHQLIETIINWSNETTGCFHNPLEADDYEDECLNHITSLGMTYEILAISATENGRVNFRDD